MLVRLELLILEAGLVLLSRQEKEFHGYQLAREIRNLQGDRFRAAYGTLYRTLERMEQSGLLQSRWEDPALAEAEGRPRRRLYQITGEGVSAYQRTLEAAPALSLRPREA
jgi:DNA-binding PadR family transcriptional regulator